MKTNVLMICLGNICRSPLAEGLLKSKLPSEVFEVDSAGTGHWHTGQKPDKRSIEVAAKYNIDISQQSARQFQEADFETFDHIFVMDKTNLTNILSLTTNKTYQQKVSLILNAIYPNQNHEVPDPYYDGIHGFEKVFQLLDEATTAIAKQLTQSAK